MVIQSSKEANQLFYHTFGTGDPILVVHGGPGLDHTYLMPYMLELSRTHTVIMYDQRGSGKSTDVVMDQKHLTLDQFVEDIEILRKKLGYEKLIVLGHSWGAYLAILYAHRYVHHVAALILLNSVPADHEGQIAFDNEIVKRAQHITDLFELLGNYDNFCTLTSYDITDLYQRLFAIYCYNPRDSLKLNFEYDVKEARSGVYVMIELPKQFWGRSDVSLFPLVQNITLPVLIIHGKEDPIPVWTAQAMHKAITGSQLIVLEKCGHFPFVEQQKRCFEAIENFLKYKAKSR